MRGSSFLSHLGFWCYIFALNLPVRCWVMIAVLVPSCQSLCPHEHLNQRHWWGCCEVCRCIEVLSLPITCIQWAFLDAECLFDYFSGTENLHIDLTADARKVEVFLELDRCVNWMPIK